MAEQTTKQKAHKLITYYSKQYEKKFGTKPQGFNRYALSSGFECMIDDYGTDRAKEIVDYFMDGENVHKPHLLAYQYGQINDIIDELEDDARVRETIRQRTIQQVKEFYEQQREQGARGGVE